MATDTGETAEHEVTVGATGAMAPTTTGRAMTAGATTPVADSGAVDNAPDAAASLAVDAYVCSSVHVQLQVKTHLGLVICSVHPALVVKAQSLTHQQVMLRM